MMKSKARTFFGRFRENHMRRIMLATAGTLAAANMACSRMDTARLSTEPVPRHDVQIVLSDEDLRQDYAKLQDAYLEQAAMSDSLRSISEEKQGLEKRISALEKHRRALEEENQRLKTLQEQRKRAIEAERAIHEAYADSLARANAGLQKDRAALEDSIGVLGKALAAQEDSTAKHMQEAAAYKAEADESRPWTYFGRVLTTALAGIGLWYFTNMAYQEAGKKGKGPKGKGPKPMAKRGRPKPGSPAPYENAAGPEPEKTARAKQGNVINRLVRAAAPLIYRRHERKLKERLNIIYDQIEWETDERGRKVSGTYTMFDKNDKVVTARIFPEKPGWFSGETPSTALVVADSKTGKKAIDDYIRRHAGQAQVNEGCLVVLDGDCEQAKSLAYSIMPDVFAAGQDIRKNETPGIYTEPEDTSFSAEIKANAPVFYANQRSANKRSGKKFILKKPKKKGRSKITGIRDSYVIRTQNPNDHMLLLEELLKQKGVVLRTQEAYAAEASLAQEIISAQKALKYKNLDGVLAGMGVEYGQGRSAVSDYLLSCYSNGESPNILERFDRKIADTAGITSFVVDAYKNSEYSSLKQIAKDAREKGMNISTSTISKIARQSLGVASRKEAISSNSKNKGKKSYKAAG